MSFSNSGDAYKASKETPSRGEVSGQQHDGYEVL